MFEKTFNDSFIQKRCAQNPEYFKSCSAEFEFTLNNGNQTVSSDCRIDLYSNGILSNMDESRNLSYNIKNRMYFNSGLRFSKLFPPEETQAQVNGSRVKRIESPFNFKLPVSRFF